MPLTVTQSVRPSNASGSELPILNFPVAVNHRTLTTVENETVPAGASVVVITPDADAWFAFGTGAAVVPSGDVTDGTGSFLIPAGVGRMFYVAPSQVISGVSASGTAHVGFEYFSNR